MLDLKARADLQRLIDEGISESLTLDYKASPALNKSNDGRLELVKDVTAFANSAGGQIIYGIPENNGIPQPLDSGVNCEQIPPEWIEQVVDTNSAPRVQGMRITKIALDPAQPNMVAYVIGVPQATTFAPHQNSLDKKYYRRFERRSVPMHDYEIRDLLRRSQTPELDVRMTFPDGGRFKPYIQPDERFEINIVVENISPEPALYSIFEFCFDERLTLFNTAKLDRKDNLVIDTYVLHRLQQTFKVPNDFPLLKGSSINIGPPYISLSIPSAHFEEEQCFLLIYNALTSGFHRSRLATLLLSNRGLSLSTFSDI